MFTIDHIAFSIVDITKILGFYKHLGFHILDPYQADDKSLTFVAAHKIAQEVGIKKGTLGRN